MICVVNLCTIVLTEREVCPEVIDGTGNQNNNKNNNNNQIKQQQQQQQQQTKNNNNNKHTKLTRNPIATDRTSCRLVTDSGGKWIMTSLPGPHSGTVR